MGLLVIVLAALLVGPFLVPVPELEETLPVTGLVYPDSDFVGVNGTQIHSRTLGAGEPAYLLLHGFAASTFSWREVTTPLAARGRVVASDRPAVRSDC